MNDLIDRQETLDALDKRFESLLKRFDYNSYENADEKTKLVCDGMSEAEDVVMGITSAESESFEWCTDCKEYDQEGHCCHRWSKMIRNTVEEIRGTTAVGEWVKVHGFCTPGGDPVWKCSNCGKGVHVYGVEHGSYGADIADHQWVACPNCGAVMIGERYE